MPIKYYILPEEREQMREEAVKRAMTSIEGPVGFYEHWPGEGPRLAVTDEALEAWRPFCKLVGEDETREELCRLDYEKRAAACTEPQISICWLGVHNAICPVKDEHGGSVTLLGGEFRVRERKAEAEELLEQFLKKEVPPEQRKMFREAWRQIPEVNEAEALGYKMRELKLAGHSYLRALKQRSDFRYLADLATHDVVIALQALIGEIEVLKIKLKAAFGIGRKWERRFEKLIRTCENHHTHLEKSLGLDRPNYAYESVSKLIYECVESYMPSAEQREIGFKVDLEQVVEAGGHKVLTVCMDRIALRKALLNVLDNAVKYSFTGTAEHPRWIDVVGRLETVREALGYSIVVRNLGIGIEEDELDLIFEPGYQGRRRLDEDRPGYGMGLTFVKECVEKHGGSIAIQSRPQRRTGWLTTAHIWLPLQGPSDRHLGEAQLWLASPG